MIKTSLFKTLILLTAFLVFVQIYYYLSMLAHTGMMNTLMMNTLSLHFLLAKPVFLPVAYYLFMQGFIYFFVICAIWYSATTLGRFFSLRYNKVFLLGIFLWMFFIICLFSANSIYFHHSAFAVHNKSLQPILSWFKNAGMFVFVIISFLLFFHFLRSLLRKRLRKMEWLFLIVFFLLIALQFKSESPRPKTITANIPNIIIVSIEALRPAFIFQPWREGYTMPFLANVLQSSNKFPHAYTPIAQSFPAWISLLTAKTPLHNGARSLYTPYYKIDLHDSLPVKLKAAGYQTFYAVDGQRFGEITQQIGFDHIISPPFGTAELIIGYMSDFPLSNLLSKTPVGKKLFPWYFANRSMAVTYDPDDFIILLQEGLSKRNEKPLFLAVHFGLSHWPYVWANDNLPAHATLAEKYQYSLHAVDQQIQNFFMTLQKEGLLDPAIVVFLSDHGMGLGLSHDRMITENNYVGDQKYLPEWKKIPYSDKLFSGIDTSYGYSTDILSLTQYQVLLAFKGIGFDLPAMKQTQVASLLDVAPTLLDLLHLAPIQNADGISLLHEAKQTTRTLFFENGFTTPEIANAEISMNGVLKASIKTVSLDKKTGLLFISDKAWPTLLANKQRAILMGDWLLARYPDKSALVLLNIQTGQWTMDFSSTLANQAPLLTLLKAFVNYNGAEISINLNAYAKTTL